jgi:hypothetical protein
VTSAISKGSFSTFVYTDPPSAHAPHGRVGLSAPLVAGGSVAVTAGEAQAAMAPAPAAAAAAPYKSLSLPLYDCCSIPYNFSDPASANYSAPCAYCGGMCPPSGNNDNVCYTQGGRAAGSGANATGSGIDRVTISALYGTQWMTIAGVYGAVVGMTIAAAVWRCTCAAAAERWAERWLAGGKAAEGGVAEERGAVYSMPFVGAGKQVTPVRGAEGEGEGAVLIRT